MAAKSCGISAHAGSPVSWRPRSWRPTATPSLHSNSLSRIWWIRSVPKLLINDHQKVLVMTREGELRSSNGAMRLEELRERTREALMNKSSSDPTATMEMIDTIQRLGVGHHFEEQIIQQLERFSDRGAEADAAGEDDEEGEQLFGSALRFRLLRHNGLPASADTFRKFINEDGELKESVSSPGDIKGMLSLYEASYLAAQDEGILLQAMESTRAQLLAHLISSSSSVMDSQRRRRVAQALTLPRHLRMSRSEAGSYIEEYSRDWDHDRTLLQLAKLDYNAVQCLHQSELTELKRWWKQLGLVDKLGFGRDRPVECFLWTVGIFPEPQYSSCRIELAKTIALLLVIDDIFDTYGSLSDLVLFTDAIKRWDLGAMDQIPEYMKICYMALYNTTNEIAFRILKEHGWNPVIVLRRTWIDIFEAQLGEAKWFSEGYVPTQEQYLRNGVTTGGTYMALVHAFCLMGQGVTAETLAMMEPYPDLFTCSGRILRLWDDLGTAREEQERGDVASSIECYMREKTIPREEEEQGRKHIRQLIRSSWVELNGMLAAPPAALPASIVGASLNLARTAQVVYQHGDDSNVATVNDHITTLFYSPIIL